MHKSVVIFFYAFGIACTLQSFSLNLRKPNGFLPRKAADMIIIALCTQTTTEMNSIWEEKNIVNSDGSGTQNTGYGILEDPWNNNSSLVILEALKS